MASSRGMITYSLRRKQRWSDSLAHSVISCERQPGHTPGTMHAKGMAVAVRLG
jgi:hypothetical protein